MPGVTVLFISAMNTQWYHFWDILDQRQLSPQLSTSAHLLSFSNFPSLPLKCGPSCLPRAPRLEKLAPFHTAWGPVFSNNCAVSSEGGYLLTLLMWVSLPVEISKLDLLLDYIPHLLIFQLRSCWCQDLLLGLGDRFTYFHFLRERCSSVKREWRKNEIWDIEEERGKSRSDNYIHDKKSNY